MPVIGFLDSRSPDALVDRLRGFRQCLGETGYVEGDNVTIVYRWAEKQNGSSARAAGGCDGPRKIHFSCSMTVPSEIVGRATPVLLAFLAIHSRAARVLSSAPALSW